MPTARYSTWAFAASLTGIATLTGDAINVLGSLGQPNNGLSYVLELVLIVVNLTSLLLSLIPYGTSRSAQVIAPLHVRWIPKVIVGVRVPSGRGIIKRHLTRTTRSREQRTSTVDDPVGKERSKEDVWLAHQRRSQPQSTGRPRPRPCRWATASRSPRACTMTTPWWVRMPTDANQRDTGTAGKNANTQKR
jgi:hypothetical protein